MRRFPFLVWLFLIVAENAHATFQQPDVITYNGVIYHLDTPEPNKQLPLDVLGKGDTNLMLVIHLAGGTNGLFSTACWRGYVADWEVCNGMLFLTGLCASRNGDKAKLATLFPDRFKDGKVKADWFTGTLTLSTKPEAGPFNTRIILMFEQGKETPNKVPEPSVAPAPQVQH